MKDLRYEELKGTGNMDLLISRKLQERRVFPAFDVEQSSTRREEMLLGPDVLQRVYLLRRMWPHLAQDENIRPAGSTEQLLQTFRQYDTNEEFLNSLTTNATGAGAMGRTYRR